MSILEEMGAGFVNCCTRVLSEKERPRIMACENLSGLAKQISELSNPRPASFNPDEEDDILAKVCDFQYEPGSETTRLPTARRVMLARARRGMDLDDPKYTGRIISREELNGEGKSLY